MPFLEVKHLEKSFGDLTVLKGIDFSMEKGEVVAIIGSSGGGKTTFLRCLNFLEKPDSGTITVGEDTHFDAEADYTDSEIREMRLSFGLVFQSFNLFPQYTALENVSIPCYLRKKEAIKKKLFEKGALGPSGKPLGLLEKFRTYRASLKTARAESDEAAKELLAEVGLSDKAGGYPCELSGGQCQRVAIARALSLNPDILCFDEPTSALDPELTGEVLRVIRSLKSSDRTMLIVTHEMEFARHVADKVIFIAEGNIEEAGTPEEIFEAPKSPALRAFLQHVKEP